MKPGEVLRDKQGLGLFAVKNKDGTVRFGQLVRVDGGKRLELGRLGSDRERQLSAALEHARDQARQNRRHARKGVDPRVAGRRAPLPRFKDFAKDFLARFGDVLWDTEKTLRTRGRYLETYAYPVVGNLRLDAVTSTYVAAALRRQRAGRGRITVSADHMRSLLIKMFHHAVDDKLLDRSPMDGIMVRLLKVQTGRHFPTLPYEEMPEIYEKVWCAYEADRQAGYVRAMVALVIIFGMTTFLRMKPIVEAEWSEIDLEKRLWTIPAEKMKGSKPDKFIVPLSDVALTVLEAARKLTPDSPYVFAYARRSGPSRGKILPVRVEDTNDFFKRIGVHGELCAHGLRSPVTAWGTREVDVPAAVIEAVLAHSGDSTRAAYWRDDFLPERRALMQQWAEYLIAGRADLTS